MVKSAFLTCYLNLYIKLLKQRDNGYIKFSFSLRMLSCEGTRICSMKAHVISINEMRQIMQNIRNTMLSLCNNEPYVRRTGQDRTEHARMR